MADNNKSRQTAYEDERNTEPHRDTGNINSRNNNVEVSTPGPDEATVETANREGIGDAAVNDTKITKYTSNHSGDA